MSVIENFQIHLNSETADKIYDDNSCYCDFYLPVIEVPNQYQIHLSLQHASIPYTFYNVNSTNDTLNYAINGVANYICITHGNYNVLTMKAYLIASIPNMNVTYNYTSNQFTFIHQTYDFVFYASSNCLSLLGFKNILNSSILKSLTSTTSVNLLSVRCICVQTNLQTSNINKTNSNNLNMLCSIPIDVAPYSIINYKNINNFSVNTYRNTLSVLSSCQ